MQHRFSPLDEPAETLNERAFACNSPTLREAETARRMIPVFLSLNA
jgi:hypothetical protein